MTWAFDYDRWKTTPPEPDVGCGYCGGLVSAADAQRQMGLCGLCYDSAHFSAREDEYMERVRGVLEDDWE